MKYLRYSWTTAALFLQDGDEYGEMMDHVSLPVHLLSCLVHAHHDHGLDPASGRRMGTSQQMAEQCCYFDPMLQIHSLEKSPYQNNRGPPWQWKAAELRHECC